jgi:hypothetical protein
MSKKSSKKQPEHPITANSGNTAIVSPPLVSPAAPVLTPAPYKPITDDVSIERLVGLAKDSPPDSALGIVWKHAYEEAYQNGRKEVLQNLGRKLEEKFIEGEKEGIKKGKEKYYGKGIVVGECEEHKRWKAAGHGDGCFMPSSTLDNSGTQTDPPTTNTTSVSTQTEYSGHPNLENAAPRHRRHVTLPENGQKRNMWQHRISAGFYCPGARSTLHHHLSSRNASNNGWFQSKSHKIHEKGVYMRNFVEYLHFFFANTIDHLLGCYSTF